MKRTISIVLFLLLMLVMLCACAPMIEKSAEPTTVVTETITTTPEAMPTPAETSASQEPTVSSSETPSETTAPEATPAETSPRMYSSYAHLVSFDPIDGLAQFDFFDLLKGAQAVDFLVDHGGYSRDAAQALVNDFGDSEFVEKNLNPQLRAIDIDDVSLSLMYQPSGEMMEGAEPVPSTATDFRAIYALDPTLLTDSFFFYVHVNSSGRAYFVEQVYWP